jgi:anti-sigma regulatory factor (Ser/Thr protein kinase)
MASGITLKLRPEVRAPEVARRALDRIDGIDPATLETARLLVSELVTNSFRHGELARHEDIEVMVHSDADRLHVEVTDHGVGFRRSQRRNGPSGAREGGWGLRIVDKLSDDWGVVADHGTVVWFELIRKKDP